VNIINQLTDIYNKDGEEKTPELQRQTCRRRKKKKEEKRRRKKAHSRGDSQTTHAIILTDSMSLPQKVKSGMGSLEWNVSMVDVHLRKLLWVYCPGHAGVKGNDRADRLAGKAALTSGMLLGRSEVMRSLRHYLRAQSQGHHTNDRLEERVAERGSARRRFKSNVGETAERRGRAHMGFSERIDTP